MAQTIWSSVEELFVESHNEEAQDGKKYAASRDKEYSSLISKEKKALGKSREC